MIDLLHSLLPGETKETAHCGCYTENGRGKSKRIDALFQNSNWYENCEVVAVTADNAGTTPHGRLGHLQKLEGRSASNTCD